MNVDQKNDQRCIIIGASHGGVSVAFDLRKRGWAGNIVLIDKDPQLPYHRPPLSKTHLTGDKGINDILLRPQTSYDEQNITLMLGRTVESINRNARLLIMGNGETLAYNKLVMAVGARPIIPPIEGCHTSKQLFTIRDAQDAGRIKEALDKSIHKSVVIIGGGYIGLEAAASLKKLGASVTVLEREQRTLARVATPEVSRFFESLHAQHGVSIYTSKLVTKIHERDNTQAIECSDGSVFLADIIIMGVGIRVNTALAEAAGLALDNGIVVDECTRTSDENIFAVGDCTSHFNPHYNRTIRLESVQNAADQAKVAAATICGESTVYDKIPWFWSDQYNVKFQAVGLSPGYDMLIVRKEAGGNDSLSVWYFAGDTLLAVDAVNHPKAYVLGTKLIKGGQKIDKPNLADAQKDLSLSNILTSKLAT